eukprot:5724317-Pleurochrysis_carterae.AAC.1
MRLGLLREYFHERPKSVPQRDGAATDESAADSRADAQIDRSSSASDACTVCAKYNCRRKAKGQT